MESQYKEVIMGLVDVNVHVWSKYVGCKRKDVKILYGQAVSDGLG